MSCRGQFAAFAATRLDVTLQIGSWARSMAGLLRCGTQSADAQQIVGRSSEPHQLRVALNAVQPGLAKPPTVLPQPKNCSMRLRTIWLAR